MQDEQIKHMVDRFLAWKLPAKFRPDNGISFNRVVNGGTEHQYYREPMGTNLLDAIQADEMVRFMVEGLPTPMQDDPNAQYLITKGGAYYRLNAEGYTRNKSDAGRFSLAEAVSHSHPNGPDGPRDGVRYEVAPAPMQDDLAGLVAGYKDALLDSDFDQYGFSIKRGNLRALITTLETLTRENAEVRREVLGLIESIWKNEFRNEAPEWRPLPDLVGMITQLDNMYAGVRSQRDEARAERDAALAEVERLNRHISSKEQMWDADYKLAQEAIATQARLGEAFMDGWDKCEKLYMPGAHPFYADVDSALIAFLAKHED